MVALLVSMLRGGPLVVPGSATRGEPLLSCQLATLARHAGLFNFILKSTFLTIPHTGISHGHPSNYLCKHLCLTSIIGQEPTQSMCYGISYKLIHNLLGVYSSYKYHQMKMKVAKNYGLYYNTCFISSSLGCWLCYV